MRRASLGFGLAVLLLGCGGDDAVTIDGDAGDASTLDGATKDVTTTGDGAPNDGGTTGDGATVGDGGTADAGLPPNGIPPDPGKVLCGGASCTLPQSCCVTPAIDGGATAACQSGCATTKLECDEAKDCPPDVLPDGGTVPQVCCYERAGNQITGSSCHRDCTGGGGLRTQACRTNAECLTGSCAVRSCTGTIKSVETCGPIANICP